MTPYARVMSLFGPTAVLFSCSETLPPAGGTTWGPAPNSSTAMRDPPPCQDGSAWQAALGGLPATAVGRVEATYFRDTCAGTALVSGTKLYVLSGAVEAAPWGRLLECGTARVRFTATPSKAYAGSPAWTPDGWVDVKVEHEHKSIVLTLHAESAAKNIQLYHRATAFADLTRN